MAEPLGSNWNQQLPWQLLQQMEEKLCWEEFHLHPPIRMTSPPFVAAAEHGVDSDGLQASQPGPRGGGKWKSYVRGNVPQHGKGRERALKHSLEKKKKMPIETVANLPVVATAGEMRVVRTQECSCIPREGGNRNVSKTARNCRSAAGRLLIGYFFHSVHWLFSMIPPMASKILGKVAHILEI